MFVYFYFYFLKMLSKFSIIIIITRGKYIISILFKVEELYAFNFGFCWFYILGCFSIYPHQFDVIANSHFAQGDGVCESPNPFPVRSKDIAYYTCWKRCSVWTWNSLTLCICIGLGCNQDATQCDLSYCACIKLFFQKRCKKYHPTT